MEKAVEAFLGKIRKDGRSVDFLLGEFVERPSLFHFIYQYIRRRLRCHKK